MNSGTVMSAIVIMITLIHLYFVGTDKKKYMNITKPLIIPSVLLYYSFSASNISFIVITALLFSLLGDTALMLKNRYFVPGMICFAFTHILYTISFSLTAAGGEFKPWSLVFLLPYGVGCRLLYTKIIKRSGPLKVHLTLYMVIIVAMSYMSLYRACSCVGTGSWITFTGSLLFIASDAALALGFVISLQKNNGVFVMATYSAAQFLIVSGML
ncbi:MAG: lysoplasmalogenase [Bacillota bacterium]|nr:lysoplasmalogenase [Bacillota bacterium]